MPAEALTVDQRLVDEYLERVDRFYNNVVSFEETLKGLANGVKDRFMPTKDADHAADEPQAAYQEPYHAVSVEQEIPAAKPDEQAVITAEDIDIDALLKDIDVGNGITL